MSEVLFFKEIPEPEPSWFDKLLTSIFGDDN